MRSLHRPFPLALLLAAACTAPAPTTTAPDAAALRAAVPAAWPYDLDPEVATSTAGMVATDAPLATEVGAAVLRDGGNAVDAAVATAFALAVVYPEAGNLGGGGFMVARMADGTEAALDFREEAPGAATADMYLDAQNNVTDASVTGHLAAGVPGSVAGLWAAHERFGTRPWAELLAPAIRLARDGFTVTERLEATVRGDSARLARFAGSAALLLPDGRPPRAGSTWRNPELAAVLERIAEEGPAGFYEGETARLIVAEMARGNGIIALADLAAYEAHWREPVAFDYRGHRVISMPPPSSGGITLALMANILEGWEPADFGWRDARWLHLEAEAMRRAFADRNHYLGDSDFVDFPRERLVSQAYADRWRAGIDPARASVSADIQAGGPIREPEHTTHFSVVDGSGNAVALTTTINNLYGAAVTVSGAGFLLNDEMDDFTSKPGVPNMYGLVQGEANAIAPGKRMLSAMTPTVVLDPAGQPLLVTGARGGPRIITAVFQVLSNVVDFGLDVGAAVNAPRIHHQHLPDVLYFEPAGMDSARVAALAALGHDVRERSGTIGNAPTLLRTPDGWRGLADPRSGGNAIGH
ncbi:MAG: gamma-glutamyltransferase [Gemmatimonadota bacterium]